MTDPAVTPLAADLEMFRRARSLSIDTGKALETVRDRCFLAGNHVAAAKVSGTKRALWDTVRLLNELIAAIAEDQP